MVIPIGNRVLLCCAIFGVLCLAACTGDGSGIKTISVFSVKLGECFSAPKDVKVQLSTLTKKPCSKAHTQESYAIVAFATVGGDGGVARPAQSRH